MSQIIHRSRTFKFIVSLFIIMSWFALQAKAKPSLRITTFYQGEVSLMSINENEELESNDRNDDDSFKVTLLSDDEESGYLIITESSLLFRDRRKNEKELVRLENIIGYKKTSDTSIIVYSKDSQRFAFKINRRDDVLEKIEQARERYYSSSKKTMPKMKTSGLLQLVNGYSNIMEEIVPMDESTPDIIVTANMEIIEAVVDRISSEEVFFYEYPLEEGTAQLSMLITSVAKVSMHNGQEFDFTNNGIKPVPDIAANTDILRAKGLWILNADNQKLTYETIERYFDEENINKYRHYRHKGNAGKTIMWIGGGILILDGVLYELKTVDRLIDLSTHNDSGPLIAYGVSIAIGGALALIGGLINSRAKKDIASLVAEWNAQQKITFSNNISFGKTSSGYGIAFAF